MIPIELRKAEIEDVSHVARHLRPADRREIEAIVFCGMFAAVRESFDRSIETWVATVKGEPACLFGVYIGIAAAGIFRPWLVGTHLVDRYGARFVRDERAIEMVRDWRGRFSVLENWVDARNGRAIRLLTWLGFTILDTEPYGRLGLPFHRFVMETKR